METTIRQRLKMQTQPQWTSHHSPRTSRWVRQATRVAVDPSALPRHWTASAKIT